MPLPCPLTVGELEALAVEHGTPFQLYDEAGILRNAAEMLGAFRAALGPGFRQFFAVKALPNPAVLRILISAGCGLDCSSSAELHIAAAVGAAPTDVIFTSNFSTGAELAAAADSGVLVNLDCISQLDALLAARGPRGAPERLCFRLNPGVGRTDSESASNVLGGPAAKFGVPEEDIVAAYARAAAAGTKRFGMHMMTGSCVLDDGYWAEAISVLVRVAAAVEKATGVQLEFLNIGGGLGIPYRPGQPAVDPAALAAKMAAAIAAARTTYGLRSTPDIHMENGRFMTGPFGWLVARCQALKRAHGTSYFGLDACMAHLMRPGMYGAYHHITVPARESATAPRALANVVGTLCENNDWFARDRDLPAAAAPGDLFVIHDTGAHAHSMGFQYNAKLRAPELLLRAHVPPTAPGEPRAVHLIRDREVTAVLFEGCRMPADLLARVPAGYPYAHGRAFVTAAAAEASERVARAATNTATAVAAIILAAAAAGAAAYFASRARPTRL